MDTTTALNTIFNQIQVGPDFDYRAYLKRHAARLVGQLTAGNPYRLLYQIPHPLAAHDDDVYEGQYAPVGDVYFNMPDLVPPSLLDECGGDLKLAAASCIRLERLMLAESFQRWGFIKMIADELRTHGYRFLILSSITNKQLAQHLYTLSLDVGAKWQLLAPTPLIVDGKISSMSVFALKL